MNGLIDNSERAEHVAEIVKAIAHPLRLRILAALSAGAQENVTGLATRLKVSQSVVSQHLQILRTNGLLVGVRVGSSVRYTLARPRLKELVKYLDDCPD